MSRDVIALHAPISIIEEDKRKKQHKKAKKKTRALVVVRETTVENDRVLRFWYPASTRRQPKRRQVGSYFCC
jgi:hypothetical protein